MKSDITHKMLTNINNLRKNNKQVIQEDQRSVRQLDKIEFLQKTLAEDCAHVKEQLDTAERLK